VLAGIRRLEAIVDEEDVVTRAQARFASELDEEGDVPEANVVEEDATGEIERQGATVEGDAHLPPQLLAERPKPRIDLRRRDPGVSVRVHPASLALCRTPPEGECVAEREPAGRHLHVEAAVRRG
jgi:hypothetical protein